MGYSQQKRDAETPSRVYNENCQWILTRRMHASCIYLYIYHKKSGEYTIQGSYRRWILNQFDDTMPKFRCQDRFFKWILPESSKIIHIYGSFLKFWYPTTMGFPNKIIVLGCFGGVPAFKETQISKYFASCFFQPIGTKFSHLDCQNSPKKGTN